MDEGTESEWHEVATLAELEGFLDCVGGFHDGVLKEIHWINRDFVDGSLSLLPERLADARLLVQRQWQPLSAVEIVLERVWSVRLDTVDFVYTSTAGTEPSSASLGDPRELLVLIIGESTFAFERMRWRDASEWMGAEARFAPFPKTNGESRASEADDR